MFLTGVVAGRSGRTQGLASCGRRSCAVWGNVGIAPDGRRQALRQRSGFANLGDAHWLCIARKHVLQWVAVPTPPPMLVFGCIVMFVPIAMSPRSVVWADMYARCLVVIFAIARHARGPLAERGWHVAAFQCLA